MSQQNRIYCESRFVSASKPNVFLKRRTGGRVLVEPVGQAELVSMGKPAVAPVTKVTGASRSVYRSFRRTPWHLDRSVAPAPRYKRESSGGGSSSGSSGRGGYTRPARSVARRAGA